MRKRFSTLIFAITMLIMVLLQTSFFPQFAITRVKPDLVLLFVISVGLLRGVKEGVVAGALGSVITGLVSWNVWGLYFLAYTLAGFTAGVITEKVEPDNFIVPLMSGLLGSVGICLIFALLGPSLELFYLTGEDFYRSLFFVGLNSAFSIPVFLVSRYILVPQEVSWTLK
jgi:rod shape-determining protein MreD